MSEQNHNFGLLAKMWRKVNARCKWRYNAQRRSELVPHRRLRSRKWLKFFSRLFAGAKTPKPRAPKSARTHMRRVKAQKRRTA